jgi:hypothetical protein
MFRSALFQSIEPQPFDLCRLRAQFESDRAVLKEAVCLPFMFSRVVRENRAARTVLVLAGKRSDSSM